MASNLDDLEKLLQRLASAAQMADRVSNDIEKADKLRRDLLAEATKKSSILLDEASKAAAAAQDANLEKFLQSIMNINAHMHQVVQEVAPADAENLSEPQKIFQQLTNSFKERIAPLLNEIDPEGKNKDKIAMLGNIAVLSTKTLSVCHKMVNFSDQMNTEEKMHAVLGTVLMVAAVGVLIAATVNPVSGPAVIGVTLAAFALHALGFNLAKKSIHRHVNEADPIALQIDAELDEVHAESNSISQDYTAKNRSQRTMQFAPEADGVELPTAQPESLFNKISHMFDLFKPKL